MLLEEFPQWKNPEQWDKDRVKLIDRLYQKHALNDQEVAVITLYPTILSDMQKARMWDETMSKKPKPAVSERGPQVAPAGSSTTAPKPTTDLTRAKQRLAKTGKLSDAAAIFETMI